MNTLPDFLKPIAISLFLLTFGSFAWAIPRFFRQLSPEPMGLRLIKWVGSVMLLLSLVVHLITREVSAPMQIAGCICFSCAFLLFWATIRVHRQQPPYLAFSREASHHIVDTGPYRYIRHPFYTSYFLGWVANGLISQSLLLLVPLICMGVLYVSAARLEERQFLGGELSGLYAPYMQRTKMFVPFVV